MPAPETMTLEELTKETASIASGRIAFWTPEHREAWVSRLSSRARAVGAETDLVAAIADLAPEPAEATKS